MKPSSEPRIACRRTHHGIGVSRAPLKLLVLALLVGSAWARPKSVLYTFCGQYKGGICADGANPYNAGMVLDRKGNLYGTTYIGGSYNGCGYGGCGVVFKLTPEGKYTVFYSFCAEGDYNCTDGALPDAGLVLDQEGNLYGTTYGGGGYHPDCPFGRCGVVFKLTPDGKETVLYSFCEQTRCADGMLPNGLTIDRKGNLYGTTISGGANDGGVVFKLTPEGKETVLHSFCAQQGCADGYAPVAGLVIDQNGNLYGTTELGGSSAGRCGGGDGCGVVFKVTPKGNETVLYRFCPLGPPCVDGQFPMADLIFDQNGNLYGTTFYGGAYGQESYGCDYSGCGTVFKLTPKGKETVLYNFCAETGCADGTNPNAGLISDKQGNLYGTTYEGGRDRCDSFEGGCGVIFKLPAKSRVEQ
jgi:uncharacterized repeat protein (TIGR03803 family)